MPPSRLAVVIGWSAWAQVPERYDCKGFTNFAKPMILAAVTRPSHKGGRPCQRRSMLNPQVQQLLIEGVEYQERLVLD